MSDQTTSVFDDPQDPQATDTPTPPVTSNTSLPEGAGDFIGEGKKYADVNAALSSIPHAQSHIGTLESENSTLKATVETLQRELDARKAVEEQLAAANSTTTSTTPAGLTAEQVSTLLQKELDSRTQAQTETANLQRVDAELTKRFGDSKVAAQKLKEKAAELNLNPTFLKDMAKKAPDAILAYFPQTTPPPAEPHTTVNTSAITPPKREVTGKTINELWANSKSATNARLQVE